MIDIECKENFVWNYVVRYIFYKGASSPTFFSVFKFNSKNPCITYNYAKPKNAPSENILPHSVLYENVQQVSMVVMNNIVFNICGAEIYCVNPKKPGLFGHLIFFESIKSEAGFFHSNPPSV